MRPAAVQRVAEPLGEGVQAGLGRAVDEVRAAGPLTGHRGEHHQRPVALGAQPLGHPQPHRQRPHVVDRGHLDGVVHVAFGALLVTEQAEGHQRHVDVAAGEALGDARLVRRRVGGLQVDRSDLADPRLAKAIDRRVPTGTGPGRQHDPAQAFPCQPSGGGHGDVGGAPEQQQGLGVAERVDHSESLLAKSDRKRPCGSSARRTSRNSSSRGYIAGISSGRTRASLAR